MAWDRDCWGKRLAVHRLGHPIYLITEILCPFGKNHPHTSFPDIFLTNFPITFFPSPFHPSNHWLQPMNQGTMTHLVISPSKNLYDYVFCLNFSHSEDFPSPVSFKVVPEKGSKRGPQQLSASGWCLYVSQNHQKAGFSLFLPQSASHKAINI